jgi:type IV pilus assembly protein PilV
MIRILFKSSNHQRQRGFTLIEVLIAVLVLGVGLLGLAALQTAGVRSNHNAYLRSQATVLAYDIIDRMRANYEGALPDLVNGTPAAYDNNISLPATVHTCSFAVTCSSQQIAENDLIEWNMMLAQILPGGRGMVCIDDTPTLPGLPTPDETCDQLTPADPSDDVYAIKIWWQERVNQDEAAADGTADGVTEIGFVVSAQPVIPLDSPAAPVPPAPGP